jgi:trans-aconitate methyltransferase
MTHAEALALIQGGVPSPAGVWADIGAGSGVFTRALTELLGEDGLVHAVDQNAGVLVLAQSKRPGHARVLPQRADFTRPLALEALDGILMANALHFVQEHQRVLSRLLSYLRPGGHFLLVEYDQETGNPWVPFPVSWRRFFRLAPPVGLSDVRQVGRRRSRFGHRDLYAAVGIKG